jgi:hypothetical protein
VLGEAAALLVGHGYGNGNELMLMMAMVMLRPTWIIAVISKSHIIKARDISSKSQ